MKRQKDTQTRVFVQKLIDDRHEQIFIAQSEEFYKYSNKELFKYLDIDYAGLIDILEDLKGRGIIFQFECLDTEERESGNKKKGLDEYKTTGFAVSRKPRYEECVIKIPKDFSQKAETYLAGQSGAIKSRSSANSLNLYIDESGNFWHGDKEAFCYQMGAKSDRFFILKYLVDNTDFQDTKSIAATLNGKTKQNVRNEIIKIRANIAKYLDIDGNDLIESKKDSGYRINPKYKIFTVR